MRADEGLIRVAAVQGAHGLDGRVKMLVHSDLESRFTPGKRFIVISGGNTTELEITGFEWHKGRIALATFKGITDRDSADNLSGVELLITRDEAEQSRSELEDGSLFYFDLIGASVFWNDVLFGTVHDIMEGGAGEILEITAGDGKKVLLPYVEEMVSTGRISEGRIDIHPIDGLFDL